MRSGTLKPSFAVLSFFLLGLTSTCPRLAWAQLIFDAQPLIPLGQCPAHAVAPDLDGDGNLDIVETNHHSHDIWVLLGDGTGTFTPLAPVPVPGIQIAHNLSLTVADFDEDGILDVAVVSFSNDEATVFFGDGNGALVDPRQFAVGDYPLRLDSADLDVDGHQDLACANRDDDTISVLWGDGEGTFLDRLDLTVGAGPTALTIGHANGDSVLDIVSADSFAHTVTPLWGDGLRSFDRGPPLAGFGPTSDVLSEDLDADGVPDLAVIFFDGLSILPGVGNGEFGIPLEFEVGLGPRFVTRADVDNDGNGDLLIANSESDNVSVLVSQGPRGFDPAQSVAVGDGPWSVVAADWDDDGDLDLATTNEDGFDLSLLENRSLEPRLFVRGDCNSDGGVALPDALLILNHLFVTGSDIPACTVACDADDSGELALGDGLRILNFLFLQGLAPPGPYPRCGLDSTPGDLGCSTIPACP